MTEAKASYETIHDRIGRLTAELCQAQAEAATLGHYHTMQRHDERCQRNRALVAAVNPDAALSEAAALLDELQAALTAKIAATARTRAARQHLEESRALVYLNGQIDGKNEALRAAQLVVALRDDPDYQAARQDSDEADAALDKAEARVEITRRRLEASNARTRIVGATIEALAM